MDEEEHESNWLLHTLRWIIFLIIGVCFLFNGLDVLTYCNMISDYWWCKECIFVTYDFWALAATILLLIMLIVAILLVIKQSVNALRTFIVPLFLASWVQFMLIILIVVQFPIAKEVSKLRRKSASLYHFESKYLCCGEFGPDDYLKSSGQVPSSCFRNRTMRIRDMHVDGCLTKTDDSSTPVRIELLTPLFQFILVIALIFYRWHLRRINAPIRSLRSLRNLHLHP